MLPDKKKWFDSYTQSSAYREVILQIENLPYPEFVPTLNPFGEIEHPTLESQRIKFYMKRIIPLTSFYYIDYISKQTPGEEIINVCDRFNYFAGMYNIVLWNGTQEYHVRDNVAALKAATIHQNRYDNVICITEPSCWPLQQLESILKGLGSTIKKNKVGYVYFAMNSHWARLNTDGLMIQKLGLDKYYKLNMFIDDTVESALKDYDIVAYENVIEDVHIDESDNVDGDVRVLFKTKPSAEV